MSTAEQQHHFLNLSTAGVSVTPVEFDAAEFDPDYRYELIHGVVIVSPATSPFERGPNELLGHWLLSFQQSDPNGEKLDATLPESDIFIGDDRRRADRAIWCGLGRVPRISEPPTIAVEFVSAGRRNFTRDYVEKRKEYMSVGVEEYWVINRFTRTMTVFLGSDKQLEITDSEAYESERLPGFEVRLGELFEAAEKWDPS